MVYFGLGTFGIYVGSFGALLIGITFNNSGYLAETFRGGLRAIPATQMKTGRSLGMNFFQSFFSLCNLSNFQKCVPILSLYLQTFSIDDIG